MSSLTNLMHPYVSPCDFLHLLVLADTHLKNIYFHKLISTGPVVDINMQSVMDMEKKYAVKKEMAERIISQNDQQYPRMIIGESTRYYIWNSD